MLAVLARPVIALMATASSVPAAAAGLASGSADPGITMWSTNRDEIVGSACGYASSEYGGINSLAAQASPYVNGATKFYAAVDSTLWNGGEGCGKCYRVSYGGVGGTDPGRAGEAIVQVVDTGSAKPFDLIYDAFNQATGASTGVFPASWEQVACQTSVGGPKGIVLAASVDKNAGNLWWIRAILYNLERGASSAQLMVGGGASHSMTRSGAFWDVGGLGGALKPIVITATLDDGSVLEVDLSDSSELAAVRWADPSREPAQQDTAAPTQAESGDSGDSEAATIRRGALRAVLLVCVAAVLSVQ